MNKSKPTETEIVRRFIAIANQIMLHVGPLDYIEHVRFTESMRGRAPRITTVTQLNSTELQKG